MYYTNGVYKCKDRRATVLPLNRHKVAIPNSLGAIAAVCCLALAWAGYDANAPESAHVEVSAQTARAVIEQAADSERSQDSEREQRAESAQVRQLPDFTFFLFPGRKSR